MLGSGVVYEIEKKSRYGMGRMIVFMAFKNPLFRGIYGFLFTWKGPRMKILVMQKHVLFLYKLFPFNAYRFITRRKKSLTLYMFTF